MGEMNFILPLGQVHRLACSPPPHSSATIPLPSIQTEASRLMARSVGGGT